MKRSAIRLSWVLPWRRRWSGAMAVRLRPRFPNDYCRSDTPVYDKCIVVILPQTGEGRMRKSPVFAAIVCAMALGICAAIAHAQSDKPAVVRLDPALDALVSPDAKLELVKGGFGFTEGLIWV